MIIDCISDLHGHYPQLEGGDLLIVAGDLTAREFSTDYLEFFVWIAKQKHKKKIVIAGNHDLWVEREGEIFSSIIDFDYLCDSGTQFEYYDERFPEEDGKFLPSGRRTLKIWGSPWTKRFEGMNPKCMAFTVDTDEELAEKWAMIPDDVDVLVTHCPPYGYYDSVNYVTKWGSRQEHTGSKSLREHCMGRVKPSLHVFGHIHEWGGRMMDSTITKFVNASHVNEYYEPVNKPVRVEL